MLTFAAMLNSRLLSFVFEHGVEKNVS